MSGSVWYISVSKKKLEFKKYPVQKKKKKNSKNKSKKLKNFALFLMFIASLIIFSNMISAVAINDTFHINLQTVFSNGTIETGTFIFTFNITDNSSSLCGPSVVYNHSVSQTTDNRGIVSLYLPASGSDGGNLSTLDFDKQYYLCYYRDGTLKDVSQLGRVPYAFRATQVNLSEVSVDSNLTMGSYNVSASSGFFTYLGSLLSRITKIFATNIDVSENITIGGNLSVDGRLGIGTSSPDRDLQVEKATNPTISARDSTSSINTILGSDNSQGFVGTLTASNLDIRTDNTARIKILSGGNVGINTTTPQNLLNVLGDANITGTLYAGTIDASTLDSYDSTFFMPLNTSVYGTFNFDGGWTSGGLSIDGGDLYAQTIYVYNITSLNLTKQNMTIVDDLIVYGNTELKKNLTVDTNTFFVNSNTNMVGIGTTSPGNELEVYAADNPRIEINSGNVAPGLELSEIGVRKWLMYNGASDKLFFLNESGDGMFVIQQDGNIGIGTTNPGSMLHIAGSSPYFQLQNTNAGGENYTIEAGTSGLFIRDQITSNLVFGIAQTTGDNLFRPGGSEVARVTSTGVGIGTTSPDYELTINDTTSNARLGLLSADSDNAVINFGDQSDNNIGQIVYNNTNNYMYFRTNNGERVRIDSSGLVGIGTDSPASKLHVYTGAETLAKFESSDSRGNILIKDDDTNNYIGSEDSYMYLGSSAQLSSAPFVISNTDGKVGINETSPDELLHITAANPYIKLESGTGSNAAKGLIFYEGAALLGGYYYDGGQFEVQTFFDRDINLNTTNGGLFIEGTNGQVGINTTTPQNTLNVIGDLNVTGTIYGAGDTNISDTYVPYTGAIKDVNLGTNNLYAGSALYTLYQIGNPRVGIGESSPNSHTKLHIKVDNTLGLPTITDADLLLQDTSTTTDEAVISIIGGNGTGSSMIDFGDTQDEDAGAIDYDHGTDSFRFRTNGVADRVVIDSSGNLSVDSGVFFVDAVSDEVGIGTTSPEVNLHSVSTSEQLRLGYNSSSYVKFIVGSGGDLTMYTVPSTADITVAPDHLLNLGTSNSDSIFMGRTDTNLLTTIRGNLSVTNATGTQGLYQDYFGNVGIGTTSPDEKLHVVVGSGVGSERVLLDGVTQGGNAYLEIDANANRRSAVYFSSAGTVKWAIGRGDSDELSENTFYIGTGTTGGDTAKLVINNSGSVGIGTSTPQNTLNVIGDLNVTGTIYGAGGGNVSDIYVPYTGALYNVNLGAHNFTVDTNILHVNSNTDNIGIGTTSPDKALHIAGTDKSIEIEDNNNAYIYINSNADGVTGEESGIIFQDNDVSKWEVYKATDDDFSIYDYTRGDLVFEIVDNGSMHLMANGGNVGVGMNSPGRKFVVYDSSAPIIQMINSATGTTANDGGYITMNSDDLLIINQETAGGHIKLGVDNDASKGLIIEENTGYVGIGISNPDYPLHVNDTIRINTDDASNTGILDFGNGDAKIGFESGNFNIRRWDGVDYYESIRIDGGNHYTILSPSEGNVGIGDTTPSYKLDVNGNANFEDTVYFDADGGASERGAITWGGNGFSLMAMNNENLNLFDDSNNGITVKDGGNVGIGTTSPGDDLDIEGGEPVIEFNDTDTTGYWWAGMSGDDFYIEPNSVEGDVHFRDKDNTETMTIDNTNNRVGIGTSGPSNILTVGSTSNTDHLKIILNDTYDNNDEFLEMEGYWPKILFDDTSGAGADFEIWDLGAQLRFGTSTGSSSNAAFYIESGAAANTIFNGDVGIGTTSPTYDLHLNGTTNPQIGVEDSTNNVKTYLAATDDKGLVGTDSEHNFTINTNSSVKVTVDTSGNVGIGTASPGRKLVVYDSSAPNIQMINSATGSTSNDGGYITMNSDDLLIVNQETAGGHIKLGVDNDASKGLIIEENTGDVGIGTTSPDATFEVIGDAVVGAEGDGLAISSDGYISDEDDVVTVDDDLTVSGGNVGIGVAPDNNYSLRTAGDIFVSGQDIIFGDAGTTNRDHISFNDTTYGTSGGTFVFHADTSLGTATFSPTAAISAEDGYFTGNVTTIGGIRGAITGAADVPIWAISGQYPNWGIFYNEGSPDLIEFKHGGTVDASIALDTGAAAFTTLNTGQGANELYAMNQDVETTDAVTFADVTITDDLILDDGGIDSINADQTSGYDDASDIALWDFLTTGSSSGYQIGRMRIKDTDNWGSGEDDGSLLQLWHYGTVDEACDDCSVLDIIEDDNDEFAIAVRQSEKGALTFSVKPDGSIAGITLDTGQGAQELYGVAADLVAGTGIGGGGNDVLYGPDGDVSINFDCSEVQGNEITCTGETIGVDEGSGSGLDADTLDSHDTSYFLAVSGDQMAGNLDMNNNNILNIGSLDMSDNGINEGLYWADGAVDYRIAVANETKGEGSYNVLWIDNYAGTGSLRIDGFATGVFIEDADLDMGGNNIENVQNITSTSNAEHPKIVLDSTGAGDSWGTQGAHISIGESGDLGSAALHMTYRGDGYGFIGSGSVSNAEPGASYLRFDYDANEIYTPDNLYAGTLDTGQGDQELYGMAKDLVAGTGIGGGGNDELYGPDGDLTLTVAGGTCLDADADGLSVTANCIDDAQVADNSLDATSLAANSVADSELMDSGDWTTSGNICIGAAADALCISSDGYLSDEDDYVTVNDDLAVAGGDISITNNNGGINFNDANAYWLKTATNWGLYWDTTNNQFDFMGGGTERAYLDLDNGNLQIDGALNVDSTGTALDIEGDIAMSEDDYIGISGAERIEFNGGSGLLEIQATNVDLNSNDILAIDKATVNTVDPVYTIDEKRYATYMAGMSGGVKEEVTGTVMLNSDYVIDFKKLEIGSDLWLFYQTTDFGENWENLQIILTPGFNGNVWYTKDPIKKTLTISGTQAGEVSYRMTANRFDWAKWGNFYLEDDDVTGLIAPLK